VELESDVQVMRSTFSSVAAELEASAEVLEVIKG
jgi:hypothetical protein